MPAAIVICKFERQKQAYIEIFPRLTVVVIITLQYILSEFKARVNGSHAQAEILVGDKSEAGSSDHGGEGLLVRELPVNTKNNEQSIQL